LPRISRDKQNICRDKQGVPKSLKVCQNRGNRVGGEVTSQPILVLAKAEKSFESSKD
jgi:hypothetical protein